MLRDRKRRASGSAAGTAGSLSSDFSEILELRCQGRTWRSSVGSTRR